MFRGNARDGRRSRLFRNDDAPASRIAEGLHCASAARASSTQPPRAASPNSAPRRHTTYTTLVRASFLQHFRLCGLARVRAYLCPRAYSLLIYQPVCPPLPATTLLSPSSSYFPPLSSLLYPSAPSTLVL